MRLTMRLFGDRDEVNRELSRVLRLLADYVIESVVDDDDSGTRSVILAKVTRRASS